MHIARSGTTARDLLCSSANSVKPAPIRTGKTMGSSHGGFRSFIAAINAYNRFGAAPQQPTGPPARQVRPTTLLPDTAECGRQSPSLPAPEFGLLTSGQW
ncbi:hypothetical protein QFZ76_009655 [Streptomyces sp. V4I2]|nr:hypothetical protein [Streptomyces sp. V4I2]